MMNKRTTSIKTLAARLGVTLVLMLLTTATTWAVGLTTNIEYIGIDASEVTVQVTYNNGTETVTSGQTVWNIGGQNVTVSVTSTKTISTTFSATYNWFGLQDKPLDVHQDGNTCTFTTDATYDNTLNISVTHNFDGYFVHFDANGGEGTMDEQIIERGVATNLSPCTFTKGAFGFAGWSTTSDGSVVYGDGASVTDLADAGETITLYAQWVAGFKVHFDANGGTGTMADQAIPQNTDRNLNANTFTRTGYYFAGWNTQADGTGTSYADGATVRNLAYLSDITLYAQWTDYYTVHFDKNDDIFASGTMADQTFTAGETKQLSKCTFTGLVGRTFLGWSTTSGGSVEYTDEQSVCDLTTTSANVTLYAQWQAPVITINNIVHFDANGGTGTMSNQVYSMTQWANLNANAFTREGYSFTNWNTAADGSGTTYTDQQNISPSSDMTLYAQWTLNGSTHYAVRFNANGGSGKMYDQAIAADATADLTANAFTRTGYTFSGWNTQANGSGTDYADGATVSGLALAGQTANLYAQWTPSTNIALTANTHDGNYWTTFYCGDAGYDITTDEAYAYAAKYTYDDSTNPATETLMLHKLGTTIAKGEAVIIVSATSPVSMTKGTDGTVSGNNDLHGVDVRTLKSMLGTGTFYVMGKTDAEGFGFYQYGGDYMPARKAYLLVGGSHEAQARSLTMVFDGDETGIETTNYTNTSNSDAWFTLYGRRLQGKPTAKGIFIHNGRKEVLK